MYCVYLYKLIVLNQQIAFTPAVVCTCLWLKTVWEWTSESVCKKENRETTDRDLVVLCDKFWCKGLNIKMFVQTSVFGTEHVLMAYW